MKYTAQELRNPDMALLRRLERQIREARELKERAKEKEVMIDSLGFPILTASNIKPKSKETITRLWLFDRRKGR